MPSRVRTHVLETLSRDALSRLISGPLGWVVRDVAPDYGIDVEVEIFEPSGAATGLTFKVQLKGMEKPDHIGPFRDIKVDHLRYWNRLDVPVLLIAYDDSSGVVFGRWIHSLDVALKPGQKSTRIRFGPEDKIAGGDPRLRRTVETVRRLRSGSFGRPYPLRIVDPPEERATLEYFDVVRALGLDDFIRLDRSDFAFTVSITHERVRVALPGDLGSLTLTQSHGGHPDDLARDSADCPGRPVVSGQPVRGGPADGASTCWEMPCNYFSRSCHRTIDCSLRGRRHACLIPLTADSLNAQAFAAAQIYLMALRQVPGNDWLSQCRATLEPIIEQCLESAVAESAQARAAFWAYNYAQFLYGKEARSDAQQWIERALELDPSGYGRRPEPRRLLGGIAWFAGDMPKSVEAYRAAVELGGLQAAGSQLADGLMHAGRYAEARSYVRLVLEAGTDNWRDWFVDAVLEELVENLHLPRQDRRDFPSEGTVLSGRALAELEHYLVEGNALNPHVWLALCLEHPVERVTTLMAGAFLSDEPVLMAMTVHEMLHRVPASPNRDADEELLVRLFCDKPEVKRILLSEDAPQCNEFEATLLNELALRSLEVAPQLPGVNLVDENNIVLDPSFTDPQPGS